MLRLCPSVHLQDFILALYKYMLMVKNTLIENKLLILKMKILGRLIRKRKKYLNPGFLIFSEETTNLKKFTHNKLLLMMREHHP